MAEQDQRLNQPEETIMTIDKAVMSFAGVVVLASLALEKTPLERVVDGMIEVIN